MSTAYQNNKLAKSLGYVFLWAGLLFIFDGFVFSQGVIAGLLGIWTLFVSLPRSFTFTKDPEFRKYLFWRAIIYLGAVVLVFVSIIGNNIIAEQRAGLLIDAIKSYKVKYGRYPDKLEEITPEFIEKVPQAKYSLIFGEFRYGSSGDTHMLFYVKFPPFTRRLYHFERGQWQTID